MFVFPAFRTDEWMKEIVDSKVSIPDAVLESVNLSSEYMDANPQTQRYPAKVQAVKSQFRRALFRQALFKVQNVEVTHDCKSPRVIESVLAQPNRMSLFNIGKGEVIREELWTIDRCSTKAEYRVTYHREGSDGYSTQVVPVSWRDKLALLQFYYA